VNLEFLVATVFGLGVGGVISKSMQNTQRSLASRLSARPTAIHSATQGNLRRSGLLLVDQVRSETSLKLERALFELPEIIDLLVVSLRAGNGIYLSFATVIPRSDGALAKELAQVLRAVDFAAKKKRWSKKLAKKEVAMLDFLKLPITVLFALYPRLELLNFGFI